MSENNKDKSEDVLYAFMAVGAIIIGGTYFFGNAIKRFYLFLKYLELCLVGFVYSSESLQSAKNVTQIAQQDPKLITASQAIMVGNYVGVFMLVLGLAGLGAIYWWIRKMPILKSYKTIHSMDSLVQSQAPIWPWILPVRDLKLIDEPIKKGKWAMCKSVLDFVKGYNLLDKDGNINSNRANKLFYAQLGQLWEGPDKLPRYQKALLAAFMAHGCNDRDAAVSGLEKLAIGASKKNADYDWVDPLLKKHLKDVRVQAIIKNHAYVSTLLCSALKFARQTQSLPASYFIWLKPRHRPLWYALNGVGRRVAFCETAGVYAHWLAEVTAGHPIRRPYIKEAVEGLKEAIKFVKFD